MEEADVADFMAQPACAACRHRQKRCDQHCLLAPYFPPNRRDDYLNCHDLFGRKNMLKMLESVEIEKRNATAESLIFEAKMRKDNPVHGSLHAIRLLQKEIVACEKELEDVKEQLDYFKNHHSQIQKLELESRVINNLLSIIPPGMEQIGEMNSPPPLVNNREELQWEIKAPEK